MTTAISATVAFLLATEFNNRSGGPAISVAHLRHHLGFPGIPSSDPSDPPPDGLTKQNSAAIRRMWDFIASHPLDERLKLFAKTPGHEAAQLEYRRWFRNKISKIMNKRIDTFLGEVSPLHFIAHNVVARRFDPHDAADAAIFEKPANLPWPGSNTYHAISAGKLMDELDVYIASDGGTAPNGCANVAAVHLMRSVWTRHRKGWQRAQAIVFGFSSSNAPAPAERDTLWAQLVAVMRGQRACVCLHLPLLKSCSCRDPPNRQRSG